MALYEKMVLISEQEYLQLKGFQMHVGERHDGDIDYGAGDDGGGGDSGDGGDGGGDDGGGDEGGAEQRRRLNEQYSTMFQREWERRAMNEPPPTQRLNEQYADYRHRMRQHLLWYILDKRVAALPPITLQQTPITPLTTTPPGQTAIASPLLHLTPSQTAAATRQGLLHPTVFRPQTPFRCPPSEYGSFHPPTTIKTISPRNRPPLQTPEHHFVRTPTYGGAARRIQFAADTPIAQSTAARGYFDPQQPPAALSSPEHRELVGYVGRASFSVTRYDQTGRRGQRYRSGSLRGDTPIIREHHK